MADVTLDPTISEKLCKGDGCGGELPIPTNSTKIPATIEGVAIAYFSLVFMALLPIFFGSFRSVRCIRDQKKSGEKPDTMTWKDAAVFPFIASAALFGFYIFFLLFNADYINLLLTFYFFMLGVLSLCHLSNSLISSLVPAAIKKIPFTLTFVRGEGENTTNILNYKFTSHDVVCVVCCSAIGILYLIQKHWITNNLFGIAFAINGVELLHLNNVATGCILLCGLFVYDVFWVFGTDVMVTVAKSFEAPIKLVFPQDILENGLLANNFAMLGLGDIVVPGIFIALLLRFDYSLKRNSKIYFYSTFIAYIMGLLITIAVMHMYKHAQPALLYLVPSCICVPLFIALVKQDLAAMFQYEDHPTKEEETTNEDTSTAKKEK